MNTVVSKSDWKLFRETIGQWQEERLWGNLKEGSCRIRITGSFMRLRLTLGKRSMMSVFEDE